MNPAFYPCMVKKADWESMSLKFSKLDQSPGNIMKQVLYKWSKALQGIMEDLETTATQIELLAALAYLMKEGNPVTQKDVAEYARKDKNTVSAVLRTLEKNGYITRSVSEDDQRAKYLVITDKGFHLVEKALSAVLVIDQRFFPDGDACDELRRMLRKYI